MVFLVFASLYAFACLTKISYYDTQPLEPQTKRKDATVTIRTKTLFNGMKIKRARNFALMLLASGAIFVSVACGNSDEVAINEDLILNFNLTEQDHAFLDCLERLTNASFQTNIPEGYFAGYRKTSSIALSIGNYCIQTTLNQNQPNP